MSKKPRTTYAGKRATDPDLTTPLHDEIVLWAMKNKQKIHSDIFGTTGSVKLRCDVEYPVKTIASSDNRYNSGIMGYVDLVIYPDLEMFYPDTARLTPHYLNYSSYSIQLKKLAKQTLMNVDKFATGGALYIEVKSKITSFGEMMRELQFYHTHLGREVTKSHIIVLAPPTPFADEIRAQGFGFVEYTLTP